MTSTHQPFLIRATLAAGIAQAAPWGIALDSLLAAQLWKAKKAHLRSSGADLPPSLHDNPAPEDLDLPLQRCETTNAAGEPVWHWMATTAWPENVPTHAPPAVHTWTGRLDHRATAQLATSLPKTVSDRQGRYRAHCMPLLVTTCTAVTWSGVGDADAVLELLEPIQAIGKKRTSGEGHVLRWEAYPLTVDPWAAGHLHSRGDLGRTTPAACLTRRPTTTPTPILDGGYGTAGLRPPYMHRSRQMPLHLPVNLDHHAH